MRTLFVNVTDLIADLRDFNEFIAGDIDRQMTERMNV